MEEALHRLYGRRKHVRRSDDHFMIIQLLPSIPIRKATSDCLGTWACHAFRHDAALTEDAKTRELRAYLLSK